MDPQQALPSYTPPEPSPAEPSVPPLSDMELVHRMAAGDEDALGVLYDRLAPMVFSLVQALLADPNDAEEAVEDAFWQAWVQAERYRPGRGGVSTWLGMIARSRALDRLRARKRRREERWEDTPAAALADARLGSGPDPLGHTVLAELRERVAAALQELPEEQRRAIELAYFRGMSQSQIAAHTGQPLGTVKTRVRLAMQKLRERLDGLRGATDEL